MDRGEAKTAKKIFLIQEYIIYKTHSKANNIYG